MVTDKRYRSKQWRRVRLVVLARDGYRCFIKGCQRLGNHADHIIPASPDMPDALFYGESNLRASCKFHNTARGWRDKLDREERDGADADGAVQRPVLLIGGLCTALLSVSDVLGMGHPQSPPHGARGRGDRA